MKVKFTIILPTFNRAHMIFKAIESVIGQTFDDWELIIIDDGSTDNTKELVQSYIHKDERIKYHYQENSERSAARNKGIDLAKEEYICFLDSDDMYHSSHLNVFVELIEHSESKKAMFVSGVSFQTYNNKPELYDLSGQTYLDFVLLNTIGTPRVCIHSSILKKIKFDISIKIGEDRELWSRIAKNFPVYHHTKKTFIEIDHPDRTLKQIIGFENLNSTKKIIKNFGTEINPKIKRKILSDAFYQVSKEKILGRKFHLSLKWLVKSIISDMQHPQIKYRLNILLSILTFRIRKAINLVSESTN